MSITARATVILGLSAAVLVGCEGNSPGERDAAKRSMVCTERDGGWFGRSEDGAMISSQTREACEERLGK